MASIDEIIKGTIKGSYVPTQTATPQPKTIDAIVKNTIKSVVPPPAPKTTLQQKIGGFEASFAGGFKSEMDVLGDKLTQGIRKVFPNYDSSHRLDTHVEQGKEFVTRMNKIAEEMGTPNFMQKVGEGLGGFTAKLPLYYYGGKVMKSTGLPEIAGGLFNSPKLFPTIGKYVAPFVSNTITNMGTFGLPGAIEGQSLSSIARDSALFSVLPTFLKQEKLAQKAMVASGDALLMGGVAKLDGASNEDAAVASVIGGIMGMTGMFGERSFKTREEALVEIKRIAKEVIKNEPGTPQAKRAEEILAGSMDRILEEQKVETQKEIDRVVKEEVARTTTEVKPTEIKPTTEEILAKPSEETFFEPTPPRTNLFERPVETAVPKENPEVFTSRVIERMKTEFPNLFSEESQVQRKHNEDQLKQAAELILKDKNKAYKIAMNMGEKSDVLSSAVNIVMAEKALSEKNFKLFEQLTRARSFEQTRRGQEIQIENASIKDNSTARYLKELLNVKLSMLGEKYLTGLEKMNNKISKPKKGTEVMEQEGKKLEKNIKEKKIDAKLAMDLLRALTCK